MHRILIIVLCALLLTGCDLVRTLLPRHSTTVAEARSALKHCKIEPDSIAWEVTADGAFASGRKTADAAPMPKAQDECLTSWIEENRIKFAFIGWETGPR